MDVEVTVQTNPVEVFVNTDPNPFIIINEVGTQGPIGPSSVTDSGLYVSKAETGQFYAASNPSGFTPTGFATGISGYLQSEINSLNNWSGTSTG